MDKKNIKWIFLLFLFIVVIYLTTLSTTVNFEDSGEFITSTYSLSISHPPGYPIYTILGKLFSFIPFGGIEWKINFMSAFFSSLSAIIIFLLLVKLFKFLNKESSIPLAFFITLFYFLSTTLWKNSTVSEVYTLHLFLSSLQFLFIYNIFIEKKKKYHSFFFYISGISLCNHHTAIINIFLYIIAFIYKKEWQKINTRHYIKFISLFILGLSLYLYLPIRASINPIINWGDPASLKNFITVIFRQQYGDIGKKIISIKNFFKQIMTINPIYELFGFTNTEIKFNIPVIIFTSIIITLFTIGLKTIKDKMIKIFLLLLFILYTVFTIIITNTPENKLFTLKAFFIPGWLSFYIILFYGLYKKTQKYFIYLFSVILIILFIYNYSYQNKTNNYYTKDYAENILKNLNHNSILFTLKDNETFPLWNLKHTHNLRPDIKIINLVILSEQWYIEQLQRNYPNLIIKLPGLKGVFKKEDIRKILLQDIIANNQSCDIYITTKKYKNFVNYNIDLNPAGILYKMNKIEIPADIYYDYSNLDKDFMIFRNNFINYQKNNTEDIILTTQVKYILQMNAFTFLEYANLLHENKHINKAIYFYQYAIYLNNIIGTSINNIYSYANLGHIYIKKHENNKALYCYKKSINLQPQSSFAKKIKSKLLKLLPTGNKKNHDLFITAEKYYNSKNYKKALQYYNQLLKLDPDNYIMYSHSADCYFNLKQYQTAVKYYKKAIHIQNNYSPSYYNLGGCYLIMGQKNKAKNIWNKGLKYSPNNKLLSEALKKYF